MIQKNIKSIFFVALAATAFSCSSKNENQTTEQKEYPVISIVQQDTIVSNQFVADIQAKKNVEINNRVPGFLEHIYVNEGQFVKKGQKLFKINDAELQMVLLKANATFQQAEADVRIAKVEVNQLQILFDKNVVADNELEMAKAKLAAAQARLAHADAARKAVLQKIGFTNIVSPFDGVIDRIPYKEGSVVAEGTLLTTISNLSEVYAYFSIPENLYFELMSNNKMGAHQKIELVLPNGAVYNHDGTLQTAEGEIDNTTGAIQYKVAFPNPDSFIKHGTSGRLIISDKQENAILIPQKSTFSIQDKTYVFVVDKENKVKMTPITIGATLSDAYIITDGIKPNDVVIYEGTQSLRDGDVIATRSIK
ncbi:efflux RND transporter periplasmic adaptor subunit [Flavobacterium agricola]|uniref:Efflux RND transporter periplasmic adaptor subunit n=1 Tax=Flavobacterium agricola TaxID=2870839 RepID=A0ABY6M397_9FLAO|nr:efflux RND transporter periplasmic adaptor subunit [Flavobacterium agricola]UYW02352.1 efflux RND transporter periplasmic adaptor subunit [Flavobacterium agricola]